MIEITEFTDPVCTWCWGSEPVLRKLEPASANNVKISYIMGGNFGAVVSEMNNPFFDDVAASSALP